MPTDMKVILLHDWLTGYRGGERVLETFCEMFPDAPIYTLIHKKGSCSKVIESKEIVTSFLNEIPGIHENYRNFLPLMPLAAQKLKIKHKADLVLSSSHCVIKGVVKPFKSKHICYIHSPMRYMYDQFDNYFSNSKIHIKAAAHILRPYLQMWDRDSNNNVDQFISNSHFVASRVKAFYGRESEVIHPFVELQDFDHITSARDKADYYVMVTAFASNKRVDLAISAFNENGKKLKIIGGGSESETASLRQMAKSNIEFMGKLERHELIDVLSKAQALIFPGIEDFGIVPLEALASGSPIIAYRAGGVLETLTNETAVFFDEPTPDSINKAILNFQDEKFEFSKLKQRAEQFRKEKFIESMKRIIYSNSL